MQSNPIQDATDPTIACNDDGTSGALQLTATVAAGSPITAFWNQIWPHDTGPMVRGLVPVFFHKLIAAPSAHLPRRVPWLDLHRS